MRAGDDPQPARLPRGPHALPQDVVAAHQRARLLDATAVALAERGYAGLAVRELIARAGVSRRTFYQLFDDKIDCVFAAHRRAFGRLRAAIAGACPAEAAWPDRVTAAIERSLELAAASPGEAHLIAVVCPTAAEPQLASRGQAAHAELAGLLRAGRGRADIAGGPSELTEQAVVAAAISVVGGRLFAGRAATLPALAPELTQLLLMPYLGDGEASRVAEAVAV
jgi:AcrR family transcriptional regulator